MLRILYLRNTPDSGRFHVLSQDTHLFLPYDLTAHRHPPFLGSSPRVDNRLEYIQGPENQVRFYLEGETDICPKNGERKP